VCDQRLEYLRRIADALEQLAVELTSELGVEGDLPGCDAAVEDSDAGPDPSNSSRTLDLFASSSDQPAYDRRRSFNLEVEALHG